MDKMRPRKRVVPTRQTLPTFFFPRSNRRRIGDASGLEKVVELQALPLWRCSVGRQLALFGLVQLVAWTGQRMVDRSLTALAGLADSGGKTPGEKSRAMTKAG